MKHFRPILFTILALAAIYFTAIISGVPEAFFPALSSLLIILLPLLLGAWFTRHFKIGWGLFGAGALTFILSQVLHIPFNSYLLNPLIEKLGLGAGSTGTRLLAFGILLGLSAGVFEETARYITLRFWRKDARTWGKSLILGAGHGGIEAILLGLYAFYILIQMVMMFGLDVDAVGSIAGADRGAEIFNYVAYYWGTSWYDFFWGALERFSAVSFHLSASVLVYQSLKRNNLLWLFLAILWHTLLDALAVYGSVAWGIPITEGALLIIALLSIGIIFLLREPPPAVEEIPEALPSPPPPDSQLPPIPISSETLDDSRYD
ncbi:MAG: YhfC family glutamic-type intramembrane protease [Chloroflexota bacterium]